MFNFGKANPNPNRGVADETGLAGTLIGDATGGIGGAMTMAGNAAGGGRMGNIGGAIGNTMLGISEIAAGQYAGGIGDLASGVLNGAAAIPAAARFAPGLGVLAGGASMIGHGIEAAKHIDEIDGGYQNNQFWTEAGWATVGGLNAAAALDPTGASSLAVGAGTFALDGIGALSGALLGEDYRFSAGSAIGAAEHLIFDGGQAIGQGIASGVGAAADWVGGGGIGRTADAIGSGIGSAATWAGNGLASIGSGIANFLSDERMKRDIAPIENALALIDQL